MENQKIIDILHAKMQEKTEGELHEIVADLISNCVNYSIGINNCKTNWTARNLLENIIDDEDLKLFDEE